MKAGRQVVRITDQQIVAEVLAGKTEYFRYLVQRYQQSIAKLAYFHLGDLHQAEDVTQETFVRAYKCLAGYKPERSMRNWLLAIAANLCRKYHLQRVLTVSLQSVFHRQCWAFQREPPSPGSTGVSSVCENHLCRNLRRGGKKVDRERRHKFAQEKFAQAKSAAIPVDVQNGVMEEILLPRGKGRNMALLPAVLGLILVLVLALPGAESPGLDPPFEEPVPVIRAYPRTFSPYSSPYGSLDAIRIKKGSEYL